MSIPFASKDGLVWLVLEQMLAAAAMVFFIVPAELRIMGNSAKTPHFCSHGVVQLFSSST